MNRILILSTVPLICIPVAFSLVAVGSGKEDYFPWYLGAVLLFGTAIYFWDKAIRRARLEDARKETQMQTLIDELRGLRADLANRNDSGRGEG